MRIESLPQNNLQTQGKQRRAWLRENAPHHLQHCNDFIQSGLRERDEAASRCILVMGAGACTELPLNDIARSADEVVLADFDLASMQRGREELTATSLRKRIRFVQCDLTGGISSYLASQIRRQDWSTLVKQGASAVFDAAAFCLEQCHVPDPPTIHTLRHNDFGLIISSLVLSQLISYPLLDLADHLQKVAPAIFGEQERHRRYQEVTQAFRIRVIKAHLTFLRDLLDVGGVVVLLTDIRGFAFQVYGTDHDAKHRRVLPLLPRQFPELLQEHFTILAENQWEWISDLPVSDRPGRGYEVKGYLLSAR